MSLSPTLLIHSKIETFPVSFGSNGLDFFPRAGSHLIRTDHKYSLNRLTISRKEFDDALEAASQNGRTITRSQVSSCNEHSQGAGIDGVERVIVEKLLFTIYESLSRG